MGDVSTIGLVAGSSVLAAALTQGSSVFRDWLKRRRDASFSALYVALNLEAFARACSSALSDSHVYEASEGSAGSPQSRVPMKAAFPEEVSWDVLGVELTTACLSLGVDVETENERIGGEFEFVDDEAGVLAMRQASADLGCRASELAADVRRQFRVTPLSLKPSWNIVSYLRERQKEYDDIINRQNEATAASLAHIQAAVGADQQQAAPE